MAGRHHCITAQRVSDTYVRSSNSIPTTSVNNVFAHRPFSHQYQGILCTTIMSHHFANAACFSNALARDQAPGSDWAILRLGVVGDVHRLVVDTNHFKGNFPESVLVEACLSVDAPDAVSYLGVFLNWIGCGCTRNVLLLVLVQTTASPLLLSNVPTASPVFSGPTPVPFASLRFPCPPGVFGWRGGVVLAAAATAVQSRLQQVQQCNNNNKLAQDLDHA